jgi:hypothetical protein
MERIGIPLLFNDGGRRADSSKNQARRGLACAILAHDRRVCKQTNLRQTKPKAPGNVACEDRAMNNGSVRDKSQVLKWCGIGLQQLRLDLE